MKLFLYIFLREASRSLDFPGCRKLKILKIAALKFSNIPLCLVTNFSMRSLHVKVLFYR